MGQQDSLKKKVFSGLFWAFGERILAQGVSFILSVVLARLLLPEQYGTITMVLVFINIADVFVSNGFGEALIQKKDATEEDFSSIFLCSMGISILLYVILFLAAPSIASFYKSPELVWVLRVLAIKLPIAGINTVQRAYVQKHMQFRKFFFSTLSGIFVSGIVGIVLAYNGFGVWALVAQYLTNSSIDTIVLFVTVSWKPRLLFNKKSAIELVRYGWKLTAASLINTVYSELRSLIIGRKYSVTNLAYYNRGNHLPSLAITNINSAISMVIFPAMAAENDNICRLKSISKRSMRLTAYLIFPIMAGLMGVAEPLIRVLLTEKWLPCIPYLYFACLYWMCQPIQTANWQIIKAIGRSDLCFKLEIVKKIIGVFLILVSIPFGVMALVASNALSAFIAMIINIWPNRKLIGYSVQEQIADLFPSFAASAIMWGIVYWFGSMQINDIVLLFLQVVIGVTVYILLSILFKIDSYSYILQIMKGFLKRHVH